MCLLFALAIIIEVFQCTEHSVVSFFLAQVVSSSLLCLAQLCVIVGPHLISYLPQFLPTTLDCLLDITNSAEAKYWM